MATVTQVAPGPRPSRPFVDLAVDWARENVYGSAWQVAANLLLLVVAGFVFAAQLRSAPGLAGFVALLWLLGLAWVLIVAVRGRPDVVAEWLAQRLYNTPASALITLITVLLAAAALRAVFLWAVVNASFTPDPAAARASPHTGATWGVVLNNLKLFLTGQYPRDELWRVWAAAGLVIVLAAASLPVYGLLRDRLRPYRRALTSLWLISPLILWVLLRGAAWLEPLEFVPTRFWGGLLLTLVITVFAIVVSFPLGVLLALGRRSQLLGIPAWLTYPVAGAVALWGLVESTLPNWSRIRNPLEYIFALWPVWLLLAAYIFQRFFRGNVVAAVSTVLIEFIRGVPLITILFMAQYMFPLFLPAGMEIENAYRAMWAFAIFAAAYLAENVRGGLQSIPRGQYEAAQALGLNTFQQLRLVILPQALRVVIPPNTGLYIGIFKDTSLVAIIGLLDLLEVARAVVNQPDWLGLRRESFFFITIIYYVGCYLIAAAGRWLERRSGLGTR